MNKKNNISLIGFAIGLILVFIFVIPLFYSVKAMRFESNQKYSEIEKLNKLLDKVEKIKESYPSIVEEVEKVLLTIPEEKDLPQLLIQFEKLAVNNGLLLESIEFGEISKKEEKDFIKNIDDVNSLAKSKKILSVFPNSMIQLKVIGSYSAFKNYINALEKNVRSMDVNSIIFSNTNTNYNLLNDFGVFEFNVSINVYYK